MSVRVQVSRTPAWRWHPRAAAAGVREAPRHEIAGGGAPAVPRAMEIQPRYVIWVPG